MLEHCRAYVVAHTPKQDRSLIQLAERTGFGSIESILGQGRVAFESDTGDIVFFLIHHRLSDDTMASIIRLLRSHPDDAIKYAPIILIIDDCPFETILKYVHFGYDDIIALPEKREIILDRLMKQLNSDQLYIETEDYLGPDRRRMEVAYAGPGSRRHESTLHSRLTIHREIGRGVRVIRRQFAGLRARSA